MPGRYLKGWLLAASLLLAGPALAQDGIGFWGGSSSSSPNNPTYASEFLGWGTGTGTTVTTQGANAKSTGANIGAIGTTAAAWAGLDVYLDTASSGSNRYLCDLSFDNSSTWPIQNLYAFPGSAGSQAPVKYTIPIQVPSGAQITARCQAQSATQAIQVAVRGWVANATSAPGYTTFVSLNADVSATRVGAQTVTSNSGVWVSLKDPTAATYAAMLFSAGDNGTTPLVGQAGYVSIAAGTAGGGGEVEFYRFMINTQTSGVLVRSVNTGTSTASVASGQRISAKLISASGSDPIFVGAYGIN